MKKKAQRSMPICQQVAIIMWNEGHDVRYIAEKLHLSKKEISQWLNTSGN